MNIFGFFPILTPFLETLVADNRREGAVVIDRSSSAESVNVGQVQEGEVHIGEKLYRAHDASRAVEVLNFYYRVGKDFSTPRFPNGL